MRKKVLLAIAGALFLASGLAAQEDKQDNKEKKVLKNADIVLMVQNHFDDETLVKVIEVSDTDFDISGDALIEMKNQGVSSAVLRAMLQATQKKRRAADQTSTATTTPAIPPADSPSTSPAPSNSSNATTPVSPTDKSVSTDNGGSTTTKTPSRTDSSTSTTTPAPSSSQNSTSSTQNTSGGMTINQQRMNAMQTQLAAMGMGNLLSGMFSMNYTPEQMPHVYLMYDQVHREKHEVSPSTAEIAQTKYKSGAPGPGESALRNLAQQALSFAAMAGGPSSMMAMSAFSMASGFMPGMRGGTPSMTYVWGLPGRKSSREFDNKDPIFELSYGDIPGVDPDAFEPVIVKLFQTKDNYRLVGATRTKLNAKSMMSGGVPENGKWISEDRWPTRIYKEDRGFYVLRVDQPLEPGEYAVVLRPVKGYKATASGLGGHAQVFYSVWDFSVPGATPEETTKKKKK